LVSWGNRFFPTRKKEEGETQDLKLETDFILSLDGRG
jgi:hypothetical protein